MDAFRGGNETDISCLFPEILTLIFENLDISAKGRASRVCRAWRDAAYNRRVWRGVEARLHLQTLPPTLFPSLAARGITKIQVLSARKNLHDVITGIPNLDSLNLSGCYNVTDSLLSRALFMHLPTMTSLNLSLCKQIRDASIERIEKAMPNLRYLNIGGCSHVTQSGLLCIARGLPRLTYLNLRSCRQASDRAIGYLCGQNASIVGGIGTLELEDLVLQDCQKLSDTAMRYVAEGLPRLRVLNLSFCASISDAGIRFLSKMASLRELNVSSCDNVSDAGVRWLAEGSASRLEKLDLSFCERVSDAALIHMSQGLFQLTNLTMRNCAITDDGLAKFVRSAPDIAVLNIGQCGHVTDSSLVLIARYLQRLEWIDLYGCPRVSAVGLEALTRLPRFRGYNMDLCHPL